MFGHEALDLCCTFSVLPAVKSLKKKKSVTTNVTEQISLCFVSEAKLQCRVQQCEYIFIVWCEDVLFFVFFFYCQCPCLGAKFNYVPSNCASVIILHTLQH